MILFDMDGVLVKYDRKMYEGDNPIWLQVGKHAFRNLKPDPTAVELFKDVVRVLPNDVKILTSISDKNPDIAIEQAVDKMLWCGDNLGPDFKPSMFMACMTEKSDIIMAIKGMRLSKSDILIDDYNKRLFSWASAGGTPFKYLNGINSIQSWPSCYYLDSNESSEQLYRYFMDCYLMLN